MTLGSFILTVSATAKVAVLAVHQWCYSDALWEAKYSSGLTTRTENPSWFQYGSELRYFSLV